ncbi:hypothetical protein O181_095063 [Austropuccinia psidii MF-1]|uniref:Uncharacterized protein n=1 Tax=Austropuccinia psidii MF-1 TaxID=1389203 RepID=A0A9Q3PAU6_9BASI|nr:hypothetical protein [Austropuccinia psidii MF-1]
MSPVHLKNLGFQMNQPEDREGLSRTRRAGRGHLGNSAGCYRRTADPDRAYSDSLRLTRSKPNQLSSGFTPFRNQQISGQDSPFFTIPGSSRRRQVYKGKTETTLSQRKRESDPMIQKLLDLVKEGHKSQKSPGQLSGQANLKQDKSQAHVKQKSSEN